ncbi:MAG: glycosyltransferase [Nitrospinae bacterium]|nr:glycosyltransferase [Nitrospinota bacterium]
MEEKGAGRKLHFHSDCSFFAGCEHMLAHFWASPDVRRSYEISFSHRETAAYTDGLRRRVGNVDFPVYPLGIFDPSQIVGLMQKIPGGLGKILGSTLGAALEIPMFLHDLFVLTRLFRRIRPDILHINNGGYPGALSCSVAAIAGKICGVKNVLMMVNNFAIPYSSWRRRAEWILDRIVIRCVDMFVTGSKATGARLVEVLRLPPGKVVSTPNGINPRPVTETKAQTMARLGVNGFGGVVFGVVALMETRKGHHVLLEALANMAKSDQAVLSNVIVLLEGDGSQRVKLEEFVRNNNLGGVVRFVGVEKNVSDFFQVLDVLVLPSVSNEDFPNVVSEAMAFGKAVVASRLAGTPEQIVDGVTGLLVTPGDGVELAHALEKMAADAEFRVKCGVEGLRRFRDNFTSEKGVEGYLNIYKKMTAEVA